MNVKALFGYLDVKSLPLPSFGNASRIDYGTGHENTFVAFLLCLYELGIVSEDDQKALVIRVFAKYLSVMRRLQIF